jgi:hypothetical protein
MPSNVQSLNYRICKAEHGNLIKNVRESTGVHLTHSSLTSIIFLFSRSHSPSRAKKLRKLEAVWH